VWALDHHPDGDVLAGSETNIRHQIDQDICPVILFDGSSEDRPVLRKISRRLPRQDWYEVPYRIVLPNGVDQADLSVAHPVLTSRVNLVEFFGTSRMSRTVDAERVGESFRGN